MNAGACATAFLQLADTFLQLCGIFPITCIIFVIFFTWYRSHVLRRNSPSYIRTIIRGWRSPIQLVFIVLRRFIRTSVYKKGKITRGGFARLLRCSTFSRSCEIFDVLKSCRRQPEGQNFTRRDSLTRLLIC